MYIVRPNQLADSQRMGLDPLINVVPWNSKSLSELKLTNSMSIVVTRGRLVTRQVFVCTSWIRRTAKSQQSAGWYYLCLVENRASGIVVLVYEITVMPQKCHCVSYCRQQSILKILDVQIIGLLWGEQPVTGGVPLTRGHLRGNRFNGMISSCGGYVLYHYV